MQQREVSCKAFQGIIYAVPISVMLVRCYSMVVVFSEVYSPGGSSDVGRQVQDGMIT